MPILLSVFVLIWTAGFDVLYACQDFEYDRKARPTFDTRHVSV